MRRWSLAGKKVRFEYAKHLYVGGTPLTWTSKHPCGDLLSLVARPKNRICQTFLLARLTTPRRLGRLHVVHYE